MTLFARPPNDQGGATRRRAAERAHEARIDETGYRLARRGGGPFREPDYADGRSTEVGGCAAALVRFGRNLTFALGGDN